MTPSRRFRAGAANPQPVEIVRLRKRAEFLHVAKGPSERRRHLVVQANQRGMTQRAEAGAGFTATRKVGNSVVRNRARRRLREAERLLLPWLGQSGADYVFIARQETATGAWPRLLDDMESALISLRGRLASGAAEGGAGQRRRATDPPTTKD